jgi:hypothetical protein
MLTYNFAALFYQVCTVASATQAAPKGGKQTFAASPRIFHLICVSSH